MAGQLVLFVHGLGGNPQSTWGAFPELLKSDSDVRHVELGYFGYPTSLLRFPFSRKSVRVQTLSGALHTLIENFYPNCQEITLVCHSLGGLIGKQYLIDQIEQERPLRVKSLILYAVPNNGAGLAAVGTLISWRHGQLQQLCRDSDLVRNISTTWQRRRLTEKVEVRYVIAGLDRVVDEHSARESWGNITVDVIVDCDHRSVVKPRAATDLSYLILKNALTKKVVTATIKPSRFADIASDLYSLEAKLPMSPQQQVRVAMSALVRIMSGDKYLLVRNARRRETFGPIGGVYKHFRESRVQLDSFDFRQEAIDAEMENDLRGKLPYKHLDEFLRWFEEGHGRESAQECLQRELREEMAEVGLTLMSDELTGVRFVHVRTAREGLDSIPAETYVQFRFFDVFDIGTESTQGQELLRKIEAHATPGGDLIWVTSEEAIRGRDRLGHVLGPHAAYLFGQTRYRPQDPPY